MATEHDCPSRAVVADATASSKRKATRHEEIEVDLSAPEPPSKRARRALKKGKALPSKPVCSDAEGEEPGAEHAASKARSEHAIWVGNLPFALTAADLRRWLVENSGQAITEESITRVKLPTVKDAKTKPPPNKGFAYVDFSDVGPQVAAIALSETELQGRRLLIKDAKSFEGRPRKEKQPATDDDHAAAAYKVAKTSRKVFVGNMSFNTTEEDLARNFEKCGQTEWVKLATFEDSGKCKGFGWVKFKEPEAAAWAVRGFVKIKEEVDAEEDFASNDGDDDAAPRKQKQFRTRKWWVNRLLGRQLKLELAEDDQTRYKKRFGRHAARRDGAPRPPGEDGPPPAAAAAGAPEPLKEASDLQVARLTGALVKHTGQKVAFD